MSSLNMVDSLLRQEKSIHSKATSFRPGQIFSGKVLKLFPNQIAEVQVGSGKVIAQLEVGLSVNDRHFFQVQSNDGQIHLKVLDVVSGNGKQPSVENLLRQMNLPVTKEHISLLQFFMKEQLPITKDTLQLAADWLKSSTSLQDSLESIKLILNKQLPFTKDVFLSLTSVLKNESFTTLMDGLKAQLSQVHSNGPTSIKLTALLNEMTQTDKEKMNSFALMKLTKEWIGSNDESQSKAAFHLLQKAGFLSTAANEAGLMNQLAEKWMDADGKSSSASTVAHSLVELIEGSRTGNRQQLIFSLIKLQEQIRNSSNPVDAKLLETLNQLLTNVKVGKVTPPLSDNDLLSVTKGVLRLQLTPANSMQNQSVFMNQALSILNGTEQAFTKISSLLTNDLAKHSSTFSSEEDALLSSIKRETQVMGVQWENSNAVNHQLKQIIRSLGLSYEHGVIDMLKNPEIDRTSQLESLKPLLMQLLADETSVPVKDAAEKLLYKITGLQVLSQEIGPIQQYVTQIPLSFSEMKTDLTIQWSGKKTDQGKIDPNYCRVLFYLHLSELKETIVDLQVQNRVMNIAIINEREDLKRLADPFLVNLKTNLMKINYHLSSVTFDKPLENKENIEIKGKNSTYIRPNNFNGVDFRV